MPPPSVPVVLATSPQGRWHPWPDLEEEEGDGNNGREEVVVEEEEARGVTVAGGGEGANRRVMGRGAVGKGGKREDGNG